MPQSRPSFMAAPTRAVRAIVRYKTAKAGIQIGLTVLLCLLWPLGLGDKLRGLPGALRHYTTQAWALEVADLLAGNAANRRIAITIMALGLDGVLTGVEAWSLRTGRWWGPWLVVAATGALLPFEVYEFVRVPGLVRALIFAVNLAILLYIARRAWDEHRKARRG
jgi:uncharacterized membrane protein (DUF2068 family)